MSIKRVDREVDTAIVLGRRKYQIYYLLTSRMMCESQVADQLKISRQAVHKHVKKLIILGLITPIDKKANPKFFKSTDVIPQTNYKKENIKISKKSERRVGKTNYNTLISNKGQRVPILRLHSIAYTCTIINTPSVDVPFKEVGSPNGMKQYTLRHKFDFKRCGIQELREINVTFLRQKTKNYDELIIYMPEKYLLEYELDVAKEIMENFVWKARKWFQNQFKCYLGMPLQYRDFEVARELKDPKLKKIVAKHGMIKTKTKNGHAVMDQSKIGHPEREFTSIEEMKADLHTPERILQLEETVNQLIDMQKNLTNTVNQMAEAQKEFFELMGVNKKIDHKKLQESIDRSIV